jgi:hypothetical protein
MTDQEATQLVEFAANPHPSQFYCAAPSCAHHAEAGTQFCAVHNGKQVAWYSVKRGDRTVNVRAESQAAAERAVS